MSKRGVLTRRLTTVLFIFSRKFPVDTFDFKSDESSTIPDFIVIRITYFMKTLFSIYLQYNIYRLTNTVILHGQDHTAYLNNTYAKAITNINA